MVPGPELQHLASVLLEDFGSLAPRYGHVSKREKGQILDQVCEVTGYTRKHALTLLKNP